MSGPPMRPTSMCVFPGDSHHAPDHCFAVNLSRAKMNVAHFDELTLLGRERSSHRKGDRYGTVFMRWEIYRHDQPPILDI